MLIFKKKYGKNGSKKEYAGSCEKFWQDIGNEKYLFKENNLDKKADFGEVIYSNICKDLDINCVEANFAGCLKSNGKTTNGVLIKNFIPENTYTISLSKMKDRYIPSQFYTTYKVVEYSNLYAKKNCLRYNVKKAKNNLIKQSIIDYFLMQEDRNSSNIEFLVGTKKMELAPIFDNADSLCLFNSNNQNFLTYNYLKKYTAYDYNEGQKLFIKNTYPINFTGEAEKEMKYDLFSGTTQTICQDILYECEKNRKTKKLVTNILDLDLEKYIISAEKSAERELPKINKKLPIQLFERKKEIIQKMDINHIL